MVEDIPRNLEPAAELGMTTVWVRTETDWAKGFTETGHIDHVTEDSFGLAAPGNKSRLTGFHHHGNSFIFPPEFNGAK